MSQDTAEFPKGVVGASIMLIDEENLYVVDAMD